MADADPFARLDAPRKPLPEHRLERRLVALEDCLRALAARLVIVEMELGRRQADAQRAKRLNGGKWTE